MGRFGFYLLGMGVASLMLVVIWENPGWPGWTGVVLAVGALLLGAWLAAIEPESHREPR